MAMDIRHVRNGIKADLDTIRQEFPEHAQRLWDIFKDLKKPETVEKVVAVKDDAKEKDLQAANDRLRALVENKTNETSRLKKALEDKDGLLVKQRASGYNVTMIRDFLDQLRMDVEASLVELSGKKSNADVQTYMQRYGQFGGFVPWTMTSGDPERLHDTDALLDEVVAQRQQQLAHLNALRDTFAFALEAATRPDEQYVRFINVTAAGVAKEEGWESMPYLNKMMDRGLPMPTLVASVPTSQETPLRVDGDAVPDGQHRHGS